MITYIVQSNEDVKLVTGSARSAFDVATYFGSTKEDVSVQIWEKDELIYEVKL